MVFTPGVSGNPAGRPPDLAEVVKPLRTRKYVRKIILDVKSDKNGHVHELDLLLAIQSNADLDIRTRMGAAIGRAR
jgi:hypothetical protein